MEDSYQRAIHAQQVRVVRRMLAQLQPRTPPVNGNPYLRGEAWLKAPGAREALLREIARIEREKLTT